MFKKEVVVEGNIEEKKIWEQYENTNRWSQWDKSLKKVVLNGTFESGTTGIMYFVDQNMPPLSFELSEVESNKRFVSTSDLNGIKVETDHVLSRNQEDKTVVKHIISVYGENEKMIEGIGLGLTKHLPEYLDNLLKISLEEKR